MRGRGRNYPHRRKKEGQRAQEEKREGSKSEDELHTGPVPIICMDYFYLSNSCPGDRKEGQALSTKELQRPIRGMGNPTGGPGRNWPRGTTESYLRKKRSERGTDTGKKRHVPCHRTRRRTR